MKKNIPLLIVIIFISFTVYAQNKIQNESAIEADSNVTVKSYIADLTSVFPNPERGWHNRIDINGRDGNDDRDFSEVKEAGHTLLHSYLRLDDFKETDQIPQSYLDNLQEALDTIRAQGLKIILRPTYVWDESPNVPESRIIKHIEQLNAVIFKNADVICHLEAGYLGKWGEWHTGRYTDLSHREDGDTRYRIIKKILETTPDNIPLAMRYPMHIREITEELPLPENCDPLTQVERDRLGHHNDCFLFNETDRGTYDRLNIWFGDQSLEEQKQYAFNLITSYGGNKMIGGETCSPAIDRIDYTQKEMAETNWTELNINYWGDAIKMWKSRQLAATVVDPAESEFKRISRKLGYRLRLINATFPVKAAAGKDFTFSASLSNDGYAGIIKPRPVYLVFDNGIERHNILLKNVDARQWLSGAIQLSSITISLPSNMSPGTFKLAIWLPDTDVELQMRTEYSVRFANYNVWDSIKGYNVLSDSIEIFK